MLPNKIKTSFIKLLLPIIYKFLIFFKANSRTINYLTEKRIKENNIYKFDEKIEKFLKGNKIIAVDVGSQGGFNSDAFFSKNFINFFKPILFDPIKDDAPQKDQFILIKDFGVLKKPNLYILGKRPVAHLCICQIKIRLKFMGLKKKI